MTPKDCAEQLSLMDWQKGK